MDNNFTEIYEVSEPDYKTTLYKKILPVPCVLWVVCIAAAIAVGYTVENAILRDVLIVVLALTVLISAAVLLFVVMPKLRIKQARLDIKNYDFKPYVDESAEETFYGEIAVQVETFDLTTTVDENEKLTFKAWYQAEHYLKNFAAENRLTKVVHLAPYDGFIPFYTFGINEA
ncbi:MAG: hypothetical protein K2K04_00975, partial [Clostridia bacterium]|nr:hypothetical protein [Clostridia bacterium]